MFATVHLIYALFIAAPFEEYVRSLYIKLGIWHGIACTAFFGLYELVVYTIRFWGDIPLSEILIVRFIVCLAHFAFWGVQVSLKKRVGLIAATLLHYTWNVYFIFYA